MKFSLDHVDECNCVGCAVSNFDLVIIVCFYSYKRLIRSTFCMNLM